jgi:hypothetical protein
MPLCGPRPRSSEAASRYAPQASAGTWPRPTAPLSRAPVYFIHAYSTYAYNANKAACE